MKRLASPIATDAQQQNTKKIKMTHNITDNNNVELPVDIWGVIINHLTLNEKPDVQYIKLAFISSVSKQINSICKKHKQNIGIQSIVVKPTEFQRYFAVNGYLNSMVYAHENGCQWDERTTCSNAADNGHLECLKYAHENGCPWNEWTCASAAHNVNLECLKYAHENGCPWNEGTCSSAAFKGHLECLKYAHENGCPWDERTCFHAANNGHLEMLKYAHENGCPWDSYTCSFAAERGHLSCLQYAHENGCPCKHNQQ